MKQLATTLLLTLLLSQMPGVALATSGYRKSQQPLPNVNMPYQRTFQIMPVGQQRQYLAQATTVYQQAQSPEAILTHLKEANKIPPEVAAKVQVERSDSLNAATDGTNIIITDTLLNKLTTSDQRAFVISHELGHVVLHHVARTQVRRVGLSLFDRLLGNYVPQGSILAMASQLGINLYDLKSSRGYEYQADDLGVKLMSQANYDPNAALEVFKILQANTPASNTPGFLMSHPITENRMRALVQKYNLSGN